jgi:hypothetical protein
MRKSLWFIVFGLWFYNPERLIGLTITLCGIFWITESHGEPFQSWKRPCIRVLCDLPCGKRVFSLC